MCIYIYIYTSRLHVACDERLRHLSDDDVTHRGLRATILHYTILHYTILYSTIL